jgi:hypothetical protein
MKRFIHLASALVLGVVGLSIVGGDSAAEAGCRHRRHRCCRPAACETVVYEVVCEEPVVVGCCESSTVTSSGCVGSDCDGASVISSPAEPVSSGEVISEGKPAAAKAAPATEPVPAGKPVAAANEAPAAPAVTKEAPAAPAAPVTTGN